MLRRGRANTLIVAKLDRFLSVAARCLLARGRDVLSDERYHLLSPAAWSTRTRRRAHGADELGQPQPVREGTISERTRDALRHMMAQG